MSCIPESLTPPLFVYFLQHILFCLGLTSSCKTKKDTDPLVCSLLPNTTVFWKVLSGFLQIKSERDLKGNCLRWFVDPYSLDGDIIGKLKFDLWDLSKGTDVNRSTSCLFNYSCRVELRMRQRS